MLITLFWGHSMANKAINDLLKYGSRVRNFVQPVIYSNGVMGGSSFACTYSSSAVQGSPCYCFDGSNSTRFITYYAGSSIDVWNPNKLKVESIYMYLSDQHINGMAFYGSNDYVNWNKITNSDWTQTANTAATLTLPAANTGFYNYYRFYQTQNNHMAFWTITMYGQELII